MNALLVIDVQKALVKDAFNESAEVDNVYVTGLQTEFCVDATCRSALSHGYDVTLASDDVASHTQR